MDGHKGIVISRSVSYAGIVRIRFDGLAFASQPQTGHPNGFGGS